MPKKSEDLINWHKPLAAPGFSVEFEQRRRRRRGRRQVKKLIYILPTRFAIL